MAGGLVQVEAKMSKYRGIVNNYWFQTDYPTERNMYTADRGVFSRAEKLHFKVANSEWSDSVVIGAEGAQGAVSVMTPSMKAQSGSPISSEYQLAITVQACPAQFWRTKKVIVSPRFQIWNHTGATLYYMQKDTNKKCDPFELENEKIVPFYLPKGSTEEPMFRINTDPKTHNWSGAISFTIVRLRYQFLSFFSFISLT